LTWCCSSSLETLLLLNRLTDDLPYHSSISSAIQIFCDLSPCVNEQSQQP